MTTNEQITFLQSCTKNEFIEFSQHFNIFRTLEEPNYCLVRDKIKELLPKFGLTENDILPKPRIIHGTLSAGQIKK